MQQTTVEHEITHALGFNPSLFVIYQDENLNTRGISNVVTNPAYQTKYEVITPKVVEMAKLHFDCDSLRGLELEESGGQGSVGSHWEQTSMGNDLMTARVSPHMMLSNITLGLLEDSGWY